MRCQTVLLPKPYAASMVNICCAAAQSVVALRNSGAHVLLYAYLHVYTLGIPAPYVPHEVRMIGQPKVDTEHDVPVQPDLHAQNQPVTLLN